jgi:2,3-bisphosphoglycerate-independent phosphoglycerate mutase
MLLLPSEESYEVNVTDEFIHPTVPSLMNMTNRPTIEEDDVVILL